MPLVFNMQQRLTSDFARAETILPEPMRLQDKNVLYVHTRRERQCHALCEVLVKQHDPASLHILKIPAEGLSVFDAPVDLTTLGKPMRVTQASGHYRDLRFESGDLNQIDYIVFEGTLNSLASPLDIDMPFGARFTYLGIPVQQAKHVNLAKTEPDFAFFRPRTMRYGIPFMPFFRWSGDRLGGRHENEALAAAFCPGGAFERIDRQCRPR